MLKLPVVHPEILEVLAAAGHGSKVLIADGDYPVSTTRGQNAKVVHLNFCPGRLNATEILEAMLDILCVESAQVMDVPEGQPKPDIWNLYGEFFEKKGVEAEILPVERFEFYREVAKPETALIIQTGETRDYANLLLTVGSLW